MLFALFMDQLYTRSMYDENCLFCAIVAGKEPSTKILETEHFLVIQNKYPVAPVHVLVLDKHHREKSGTISGVYSQVSYWDTMFDAINQVITKMGLDKSGYKLVNNGAGYNHFEHEHFHVLGGTENEPGGRT